jgi:hypothetical protein
LPNREKVIEGLNALSKAMHENQCYACSHEFVEVTQEFGTNIIEDALELLKEQEGYVSVPFSWLVKFCTHIDFAEPLTDAEREVAWKQKLRQQFGIDEIT